MKIKKPGDFFTARLHGLCLCIVKLSNQKEKCPDRLPKFGYMQSVCCGFVTIAIVNNNIGDTHSY